MALLTGYVACQDDYAHDVHAAEYIGRNDYGQDVYEVVCGEFIERYTADVVRATRKAARHA